MGVRGVMAVAAAAASAHAVQLSSAAAPAVAGPPQQTEKMMVDPTPEEIKDEIQSLLSAIKGMPDVKDMWQAANENYLQEASDPIMQHAKRVEDYLGNSEHKGTKKYVEQKSKAAKKDFNDDNKVAGKENGAKLDKFKQFYERAEKAVKALIYEVKDAKDNLVDEKDVQTAKDKVNQLWGAFEAHASSKMFSTGGQHFWAPWYRVERKRKAHAARMKRKADYGAGTPWRASHDQAIVKAMRDYVTKHRADKSEKEKEKMIKELKNKVHELHQEVAKNGFIGDIDSEVANRIVHLDDDVMGAVSYSETTKKEIGKENTANVKAVNDLLNTLKKDIKKSYTDAKEENKAWKQKKEEEAVEQDYLQHLKTKVLQEHFLNVVDRVAALHTQREKDVPVPAPAPAPFPDTQPSPAKEGGEWTNMQLAFALLACILVGLLIGGGAYYAFYRPVDRFADDL